MTDHFILERAKVMSDADAKHVGLAGRIPWDKQHEEVRALYIAMAQALTDHEREKGWKVIERPPTRIKDFHGGKGIAHTIRTGPAKDWDAAPAYPGESK